MTEYRIDELAAAAGTSVRNVRVYQERGLLAPPRRVGRTGLYADTHLARLRLIRAMLGRGYTFATIDELLRAAGSGAELADVLGGDPVRHAPWPADAAERHDRASIDRLLGPVSDAQLRRLADIGLVSDVDGDGLTVTSGRLLQVGHRLVEAGLPLDEVVDLAEILLRACGRIAHPFVDGDLAPALLMLRPLAREAADAAFAVALRQASQPPA